MNIQQSPDESTFTLSWDSCSSSSSKMGFVYNNPRVKKEGWHVLGRMEHVTSRPPSTYPSSWCTSSSLLESRSSTGPPPSSPGPWPGGCQTAPGSARWLPSPRSTSWEGLWWNSAQEHLKSIRVTEHTQGPRGGGKGGKLTEVNK